MSTPASALPSLTCDRRLAEIAGHLERSRWAVELLDPEWKLIWISDELKALIGEYDEEKIGYGRHIVACRFSDTWRRTVVPDTPGRTLENEMRYMVRDTPGGKEALCAMVGERWALMVRAIEPVDPPPLWFGSIEFVQGSLPPVTVNYISVRVHDEAGDFLGTVGLYGPSLPARVLALVARGNPGMFERMSRLVMPGRRRAAVLFADLQASGALSRRLPSGVYFKLIRSLTTAMDEAVIRGSGIVGKHAGDGVTAFFLADDLGSTSRAARAAIETARRICASADEVAGEVASDTGLLEPADCRINVGLHWGGTLYMGQVVTGGRLEVTALGDEVNECARIQQTARDGATLASKSLIERLSDEDAAPLGLDPDGLTYRVVAELEGAGDKAVRDAGGIPVASLSS